MLRILRSLLRSEAHEASELRLCLALPRYRIRFQPSRRDSNEGDRTLLQPRDIVLERSLKLADNLTALHLTRIHLYPCYPPHKKQTRSPAKPSVIFSPTALPKPITLLPRVFGLSEQEKSSQQSLKPQSLSRYTTGWLLESCLDSRRKGKIGVSTQT